MGWINLFVKDIREHALALFSLALGLLLVVFVALEQQRSGAFSLTGFEVVRFSLFTVIPLITFIVGNRLVVSEYVGGTRKFVEALPIQNFAPLTVKYGFGLIYIVVLCTLVVLVVASAADAAEDIDQRYLSILLLKTCVIGILYWSVVFFVSLTGRIRLIIYVVMGLTLMYLTSMPSFDASRIAPIAIMEQQLFVFEREIFPWSDIIQTLIIATLFVIAGFAIALVNEGSVAEQLGKPISKRDMVAFALLGLGCMTVYTTLKKSWESPEYTLSGEYVIRNENPAIAVSYIGPEYRAQADLILEALADALNRLKTDVGLDQLPQVQIALNTELENTEINPELVDGVLVSANFTNYDTFEHKMLQSIALHHLLLSLTNGRWDYETRHWILDGLARWWTEGDAKAWESENNDELFALAVIARQKIDQVIDPLQLWQTVTDEYGFEAADALSYTAMLYLEKTKGKDTVVQLAADYINEQVGSSSIESVKRLFHSDADRFQQIVGLELQEFSEQWTKWLLAEGLKPSVAALVASVPRIQGEILSVVGQNGSHRLQGRYRELADYVPGVAGMCVLRHQLASAFLQETMIYTTNRDRQECKTSGVAHDIDSPYAPGDQVYGLLEFESEQFHRPIPIWVGRIHVQ